MRWSSLGLLVLIAAGLAAALIFANVALLGVGEDRDEPVGRLSPRSIVAEHGIDTVPGRTDAGPLTQPARTEPASDDSGEGEHEPDEDD